MCAAWRGLLTASMSVLAPPAPKCRCTPAATGHHACGTERCPLSPIQHSDPSLSGLPSSRLGASAQALLPD